MGNKTSNALHDDELRHISSSTGFSMSQIERLYSRFCQLDRSNCGHLSREDFVAVPELAVSPLCERLVQLFLSSTPAEQTSTTNSVDFRKFANILAAFKPQVATNTNEKRPQEPTSEADHSGDAAQPTTTLYTKLDLMYKFYDADSDGKIGFSDLKNLIKSMVGNHIEDSQLDKITLRAFIEVDVDRDGHINFEEFCKVVKSNELDDRLRVKFFG